MDVQDIVAEIVSRYPNTQDGFNGAVIEVSTTLDINIAQAVVYVKPYFQQAPMGGFRLPYFDSTYGWF